MTTDDQFRSAQTLVLGANATDSATDSTPVRHSLAGPAASALRIRRVDAFAVRLPLAYPVMMAGVELRTANNLMVRVEAESGAVGWGEATAAPTHGGDTLEVMTATFRDTIVPFALGRDALALTALANELMALGTVGSSAAAAFEIALYDLVGVHLGVPVWALLGGKRRNRLAPLSIVGTGSVEADLQEATRLFGLGHRFFKLKFAVKSLDDDIRCALAMRDRFGDTVRLCADANGGLSEANAMTLVRDVAGAGLLFIEQPVAPADAAGCQRLAHQSAIPIGLDESITSTNDLLAAWSAGVGGVSLKTLKFGGLGGVLAAAHVCQALGLQINLSGKIAETSVGSAALLHVAAAVPSIAWGISPSHMFLANDLVHEPLALRDGLFAVPDLPGLGVRVDEALVRRMGDSAN